MTYRIENEHICLTVDEYGQPQELFNKDRGVNYLRSHDFWRLIVQDEDCLEIEVIPDYMPAEIMINNNQMTICQTNVRECFSKKKLSVSITIKLVLEKDQLKTGITVKNDQPDMLVKEVHFPLLAIRDEAIKGVVTTYTGGQYFKDVKAKILKSHTQFKGIDQYYIRDVNCYPTNAMNCMLVDHGHEGLYLGCHDSKSEVTAHILELDDKRDFNMVMARFPYTKTGEAYQFDDYILSPYRGSWQTAADKYRKWADSWYQAPNVPDCIKDSNGWQRIIMKTQYGRVLFPYDNIMKAFKDVRQAGIDTLFLFGWHVHGMDNGYPDYSYDEKQGGMDALKKSIKEVQDAGGKIILYFNGQLIDKKSAFYKTEGRQIATKLTDGEPELHCYSFPGPGITAHKFGNCSFTTACPSSEEWLNILKGFIDQAIELEVDSVFFDQIGNMAFPCCDPDHDHPVPFFNANDARMHQLKELRSYLKERCPQMGFGIEWLSDITAQHVDFVHIWGNIAEQDSAIFANGDKPHSISFQEFFHYAFPETIFSNREIRTDEDIERRVNTMLLKGCISDVEIYRCQATIADTPHYQHYLTLANKLRDSYKEILVQGTFLADSLKDNIDNNAISIASWQKGETMAIMLTQSHLTQASCILNLPGYHLESFDSIQGDAAVVASTSQQVTLPMHSLVILYMKKETPT